MQNLIRIFIATLCLIVLLPQAQAAPKGKSKAAQQIQKERLVLMPLRVGDELQSIQGAMESSLVDGLQQKYTVMWGEEVEKKAREIFRKENQKHDCNEERCMQGIAEAFQSELLATANVTKQEGSYVVILTIQNLFDHVVVFTRPLQCKGCDSFQVVDKLKELGVAAAPVAATQVVAAAETPQPKVNLNDPDGVLWAEAQKGNSVEDYQVYIDTSPKGKYLPFAKARIKKIMGDTHALVEIKPGKIFKDCADCSEMVVVPSGSFEMGANNGGEDEKPVHHVTIGRPFALGKYEVTQGEWQTIMGSNPSNFQNCGSNCPVENVNWDDVQEFIRRLNLKTGKQYRLPTEAEWEYACRAGQQREFCGSNDLNSVAWHAGNSGYATHPIGQKQANDYGLYDMSGNVWEWVQDSYHDSYNGAPNDGSEWDGDSAKRVLRGGSWINYPKFMRVAFRFTLEPMFRTDDNGFRLARTLP